MVDEVMFFLSGWQNEWRFTEFDENLAVAMQDLAVTNENLSVVIFVATYFSFIGPRKPKLSMNINRIHF